MIIVLGSVRTTAEHVDELLGASIEHVLRSRGEPGCLSHDVAVDAQDPLRLMFIERWADAEALQAHFAVPESRAFVAVVRRCAASDPVMEVHAVGQATGG